MRGVLLAISVVGAVVSAVAAKTTLSLQRDRAITGNECKGHAHGAHIPYPGNCEKFLICEYYNGTVMDCPSGTHFNAALQVCDWPTSAGCTEGNIPPITTTTEPSSEPSTIPTVSPADNVCVGEENGSLAPYPYDCNWYIRCEDSSPLVLRCQDGKVFNAILLVCDYPENVHCVTIPYPTSTEPPKEPNTESITTTTELPTQSPTKPPITESTTDLSTLSTEPEVEPVPTPDYCANQPNNTFLPYPCSCSWYIRCEKNCAHIEPCGEGRIFNNDLKICDFPENTVCPEQSNPSIETSTEPSIELFISTTVGPDEVSTHPPYIGTGICQNMERGTLLPYPGRCDLFIECIEPAPTTFSCSPGFEFNPEAGCCLLTAEADCSVPRTTTEPTTTTVTITPPNQVGICSSYPIGDLIPYPGNCSQYIHCKTPIPTAEECPTGLEFNANLKICESFSPLEPPTPESPVTPSTPSEGGTICSDREDNDLVSYPGDCSKFVICEQPIPSAGNCEQGLVFNSDLGICDNASDIECVTSAPPPHTEGPSDPTLTGICKGHQKGDLVAYPDSCTKYIRCSPPVPVAEACKHNKLFNELLGICDTTDSGICPGYSPTPEPGEGPTTDAPPSSTNSTNGMCKGHNIDDVLPYPGQCNKFIQCQLPVPYARTCLNGFHFNANLSICDNPETAGCETNVIPTPESPSSGSNVCCGAQNGSFVPYPEDCTQYIQCIYPIPIALQCKGGLHFNSYSQACEPIESAACQWYTTTTIAPFTCENQADGTVFPYQDDCKRYYYCSDGDLVLLDCTIGAIFDETVGNCVPGNVCP